MRIAHALALVACSSASLGSACSSEAPPPRASVADEAPLVEAVPVPPRRRAPPAPSDDDPLAGLDDIEALRLEEPDVPGSLGGRPTPPPPGGCAPQGSVATRLWPKPGPTAVVAVGDDGFVAAGYAGTGDPGEASETLFAVAFSPRRPPRPLYASPLEAPLGNRRQPPGLAALEGGRVAFASVDGEGHVALRRASLRGRVEAPARLDDALADRRFPPAVAAKGTSTYVAYVGTPLREGPTPDAPRLRLVRLNAALRVAGRWNPAPSGMGGVAPTFADGRLAFVEAREAISALLVGELEQDATGEVLTPLANVYDPVAIALAEVHGTEGTRTLVGYTAVGQGARTAVGLVQVGPGGASPPTALVPGEGYGRLGVDVAAGPEAALFVADAPRGEDATSPRRIRAQLVRVGARAPALGPEVPLSFPGEDQRFAHVARHGDGTYAIVASGEDAVYAHFLRCDDGGS
ncbi:MAG: hypothetical protein AAGH15_25625 [Myxococcota bacterium]